MATTADPFRDGTEQEYHVVAKKDGEYIVYPPFYSEDGDVPASAKALRKNIRGGHTREFVRIVRIDQ